MRRLLDFASAFKTDEELQNFTNFNLTRSMFPFFSTLSFTSKDFHIHSHYPSSLLSSILLVVKLQLIHLLALPVKTETQEDIRKSILFLYQFYLANKALAIREQEKTVFRSPCTIFLFFFNSSRLQQGLVGSFTLAGSQGKLILLSFHKSRQNSYFCS